MGEHDNVDLDRATARAWSRFQRELAEHILGMEDDDVLVVDAESSLEVDADGAAPYVQFCAWGQDMVRAEVCSNEYLDPQVCLDDDAEAALVDLGWHAPSHAADEPADSDSGSANFYLDTQRRACDRVAAMAVAALRDVFGVPHPAFLSWPEAGGGDETENERHGEGGEEAADRPGEPLVLTPESAEHLRTLVAEALRPPDGPEIAFDEDGDIPLPHGSALLYVRVCEAAPVIEVFSLVVRGVLDAERARFEVAVLNRDTRVIKFVQLDDAVLATVHLPAMPFAPRQLRSLVSAMAEVVDRVDDDLVARLGGRRGLDPEPGPSDMDDMDDMDDVDDGEDVEDKAADEEGADEDDESTDGAGEKSEDLHPALLTLLHLDPHGEGVDAGLAASVCGYDRGLVLRFLRAALRVIVEQQWAESSPDRTERRPRRGRDRARRRSVRPGRQSLIDDAVLRRHGTGQAPLFEEPDV